MWAGDGEQQPAGLRPRVSGEGAGGGPSPGLGGARALCARLSGPLPCGRGFSSDLSGFYGKAEKS